MSLKQQEGIHNYDLLLYIHSFIYMIILLIISDPVRVVSAGSVGSHFSLRVEDATGLRHQVFFCIQ